ncbi:MAG: hypothetical protein GDA45_07540 [Chromatiales bacterium]|nr:hypothetical protein [Chromatiales bacterium]
MTKLKAREGDRGGMSRSKTSATIDPEMISLEQFLWFIEERESIRLKKESGQPRPWTDDEILDKTRFANIYRQDDKVSRFIFEKVKDLDYETLVYNLLLSRLINRVDVLSKLLPCKPSDDISFILEGEGVIMNSQAYQISPGMCKLDEFETNRETIVYYPKKVYKKVADALKSTDSIKDAVDLGNKAYGGTITFAMFQIVLDLQYLRSMYNPTSEIPIGQGAQAVIDKLGGIDNLPEELRKMHRWDVEHAACEYRKYLYRHGKKLNRYSYKPNSMGI